MRRDGRSNTQIRPLRFTPNYLKNPLGSVLVECGETIVLCSANVEDSVPGWMRNQRNTRGWLTAEYSMLPSSTHSRSKRERQHISGRSQEIQRLIGRSLRAVVDLTKIPDCTIVVDCDVLQADGGTRTASISGSYVALHLAINTLLRSGRLKYNPIINQVSAISVGVFRNEIMIDLNYEEDSNAALDMNIVMTQDGKLLEIQGTAERAEFDKKMVVDILDVASEGLKNSFHLQQIACDGQIAEG